MLNQVGRTLLLMLFVNVAAASELIDFQTTGVRGAEISLSELRGDWVLVNFWATWCKPCRKEIPELSALHQERENIHVLGLAFEEVEQAAILAFLEDYQAVYPIALIDVYNPPEVFGSRMVLPTTVVISPQGEKVKTFLGPITRDQLEQWIEEQTEK
jgi:thiol-disulfide isomerase/thioredoxin